MIIPFAFIKSNTGGPVALGEAFFISSYSDTYGVYTSGLKLNMAYEVWASTTAIPASTHVYAGCVNNTSKAIYYGGGAQSYYDWGSSSTVAGSFSSTCYAFTIATKTFATTTATNLSLLGPIGLSGKNYGYFLGGFDRVDGLAPPSSTLRFCKVNYATVSYTHSTGKGIASTSGLAYGDHIRGESESYLYISKILMTLTQNTEIMRLVTATETFATLATYNMVSGQYWGGGGGHYFNPTRNKSVIKDHGQPSTPLLMKYFIINYATNTLTNRGQHATQIPQASGNQAKNERHHGSYFVMYFRMNYTTSSKGCKYNIDTEAVTTYYQSIGSFMHQALNSFYDSNYLA